MAVAAVAIEIAEKLDVEVEVAVAVAEEAAAEVVGMNTRGMSVGLSEYVISGLYTGQDVKLQMIGLLTPFILSLKLTLFWS